MPGSGESVANGGYMMATAVARSAEPVKEKHTHTHTHTPMTRLFQMPRDPEQGFSKYTYQMVRR